MTFAFPKKSSKIPAMMTFTDIQEQLEQLDLQIIKLVEERVRLCDGQGVSADEELESLSLFLEEGAERGLDESKVEKLAKIVIALCRKGSPE